jgi:hypothetical protein
LHPADRDRVMSALPRSPRARHEEADGTVMGQGSIYDVTQQQIDERLRDLDKLQAMPRMDGLPLIRATRRLLRARRGQAPRRHRLARPAGGQRRADQGDQAGAARRLSGWAFAPRGRDDCRC